MLRWQVMVFVFVAWFGQGAFAADGDGGVVCDPFVLMQAADVHPQGDTIVVVTHASTHWDTQKAAKKGIDEVLEYANRRELEVMYLESVWNPRLRKTYYLEQNPDFRVDSDGGEFPLKASGLRRVILAGGYWEHCQAATQCDLLKTLSGSGANDLRMTVVLNASYSLINYFYKFPEAVKNAGGAHSELLTSGTRSLFFWIEMLTTRKNKIALFKEKLPPYGSLPKKYEVRLYYNNRLVEVLRESNRPNPPVFRLEYIDSIQLLCPFAYCYL